MRHLHPFTQFHSHPVHLLIFSKSGIGNHTPTKVLGNEKPVSLGLPHNEAEICR